MICKFAHVLTAAVYIAWRGLKVWIEKFAKWWCHTLELYSRNRGRGKGARPTSTIRPMLAMCGLDSPTALSTSTWKHGALKKLAIPKRLVQMAALLNSLTKQSITAKNMSNVKNLKRAAWASLIPPPECLSFHLLFGSCCSMLNFQQWINYKWLIINSYTSIRNYRL